MTWDPGIPGIDLDDEAQVHLIHKMLKLRLPGVTDKVASMKTGLVNINRRLKIRVPNILLDSGALHSSYIRKSGLIETETRYTTKSDQSRVLLL